MDPDAPSPRISRKAIADALETRLRALEGYGVTVYRGEIPTDPPLLDDDAGRVAPYVVLFSGTGTTEVNGDRDVAGNTDDLRGTHLLHTVAGYEADCLDLYDVTWHLLHRWQPAAAGPLADLGFGRMRPPPGYDPGQVRKTDAVPPARFWLPQQWQLDTTT